MDIRWVVKWWGDVPHALVPEAQLPRKWLKARSVARLWALVASRPYKAYCKAVGRPIIKT